MTDPRWARDWLRGLPERDQERVYLAIQSISWLENSLNRITLGWTGTSVDTLRDQLQRAETAIVAIRRALTDREPPTP